MIEPVALRAGSLRHGGFLASAVIAGPLLSAPILAQESADVAAGHELARKWCANCHLVDAGQIDAGATGVPPFPSIAAMKSTKSASLRAFLTTPHGKMPSFELSRRQIDTVTACILSVKK
jgi:mono/diheme cytochrome c family protein